MRPFGVHDRVVGLGDAVPALVAIHGVIPTADRRDRNGSRQRREEANNVLPRRSRRRVAAVGKGMDERRHGGRGENAREHRGMILMRMHTARRHQAHDVAGAAGLPQAFDQALECGRPCDIAASDRRVDAGQILQHETAGADVEMSDLGIAHLPRRQADVPPDVCKKAWGQVAHKRSKLGVRACRMALSAASSRQPQPSSTTSITGRRFCISTFPYSPALPACIRPAATALRRLCGIAASSSTSAAARRDRAAMWNRAFRVTPARFLLRATMNPLAGDQFALVIG